MVWSVKIESVISCGLSLHDLGVNNWALSKEQALRVLDMFEMQNIAVLGGDVYEMINSLPSSNYDNWCCDQNANESLDEYVSRSNDYAKRYIRNYRSSTGREVLFVLVAK